MNLREKVEQLIDKATVSKEVETLIDNSGLEVEGENVTEKVEDLIDKADWERHIQESLYNLPSNEAHTLFKRTSIKDVSMFDFSKVGTFAYMFLLCEELEHIDIDVSNGTMLNSAFLRCTNLKTVNLRNTNANRSLAGTFQNCYNLISVETLDCSNITAYASPFSGSNNLVTLKFVAGTIKASIPIPSPVLSDESIQSIIDGLATVETAQKLTLNTAVVAKLTDEQMETILSKNWSVT